MSKQEYPFGQVSTMVEMQKKENKKHADEIANNIELKDNAELTLVTWNDSARYNTGWTDKKNVMDAGLHQVFTVGFIIEDAKDYIVLTATVCEGKCHDVFVIPTGCIISRKYLGKVSSEQ